MKNRKRIHLIMDPGHAGNRFEGYKPSRLHFLRHKLHLPWTGQIVCWTDADGVLWGGLQCDQCGKVFHKREAPRQFQSF